MAVVAGNMNRRLIGWGMAPCSEVGRLFAFVCKSLGANSD